MNKQDKVSDITALNDINEIFRPLSDISQSVRERTWFRNILFYLGEQWIAWMDEGNMFANRFALNSSEPMPVSNVIRDHVRSMKALILNKKYKGKIWPNSYEQKDKDSAELGEMILVDSDAKDCGITEDIKELCALWVALTGNAFARTYASMDNGIYVKNAKGEIIPRGEVTTECIIPFNIIVPTIGQHLKNKSYVGIKSLKEKEWVEDTFKIKIATDGNQQIIDYEKQLMDLVANVSSWKGKGLESINTFSKDSSKYVVFKEVEYRPTKTYSEGRYVAVAGDQVVINDTKLPIPISETGEWEYTITDFKYNHTPGSFWATSSIDDLISPQIRINEIDKALSSNRKSVGRPYVITPKDLILKRKSLPGQDFLLLEFDAMSAGGAVPQIVNGTPYPQQVLEERKLNKEVIQDAAGDPKHILRGQSPGSGSSGYMVDMLQESAEASHTPDIDRFYRSWNRVKRKEIILVQSLYTEDRLLKVAGKGNDIIVKSFKGSDLHNNTDVRMELESGTSRTRAGQNQFMTNLIQNGFFGDISQKPKLQYELMKRFGMAWMPSELSIHEEKSAWENAKIINATEQEILANTLDDGTIIYTIDEIFYMDLRNPDEPKIISSDPVFKFGDHKIHYDAHLAVILGKEFLSLSPVKQQILIQHADIHKWELNALEEKAAYESAMLGNKAQPPVQGTNVMPLFKGIS